MSLHRRIKSISGWLSKTEVNCLYNLALNLRDNTEIVEIGSWHGRSTIVMATALKDYKMKSKVHAIDPHTGSREQRMRFKEPIDTFEIFKQNLENHKVSELVTPIKDYSQKASINFNKPIGLLFIDGAHDIKNVTQDYNCWFNKVVDGGYICFHDTWHFTLGPQLVTIKELLVSNKIKKPRLAGTITYFTKTKQNTISNRIENIIFIPYRSLFGIIGFIQQKLDI